MGKQKKNRLRHTKRSSMPRCDWKRCMKDAEFIPVLKVEAPDWSETYADVQMETNLNVCEKHAQPDVKLYLDGIGYVQMVRNFAVRKLPVPDLEDISVIFKPVEDRRHA